MLPWHTIPPEADDVILLLQLFETESPDVPHSLFDGQLIHAPWPVLDWYHPAGQLEHVLAATSAATVPAPQLVQPLSPVDAAYVPIPQLTHSVAPVKEE